MEQTTKKQGRRDFVRSLILGGCVVGSCYGKNLSELQTQMISPSFFSPRNDTLVTWLGMAGVMMNCRGTILLIDPLITLVESDGEMKCEGHYRLRTPLPIESHQIPRVDAVLYTHADGDHFSSVTAEMFVQRKETLFVATPPVTSQLVQMGVSEDRIILAEDFKTVSFGSTNVEVTPALHDWQEENPWKRGDCCGFVVRTPDGSVWHPGDTRLIDELLAVRDVDVLFFDIAAVRSHLGPEGSAKLAVSSGAKVMVAYHYGTFVLPPGSFGNCDPKDALSFVEGLSARFLQPPPGEVLRLPLAQ
jgi:L-ascorbate metabolism protein UlaG (beta-lactamase superfamily)